MSASASAFPNWVMLEPFVFRRDDDESFSDGTKSPIWAYGYTSWDSPFRVGFSLAEPPLISRLYAQLEDFPDPKKQVPLAVLATHRHLVLFRVGIQTPALVKVQDFFIYDASVTPPSSLKRLPVCTEREPDYSRRDGRVRRPPSPPSPQEEKRRLLAVRSMGVLCRGEQEFVVAELKLFNPSRSHVFADICFLRSCISADRSADPVVGGAWRSMRLLITTKDKPDDAMQLGLFQTDTVIPFGRFLCWIDYYRGMLLCDVFREPNPTVSFLRFPLREFPSTNNRSIACSWLYRSVSAIDAGRALKFVNVVRNDDIGYGALKPCAVFTITCHTLTLGSNVWNMDCMVTSEELWSANSPESLPREILMFPQVNLDRPHIVYFLVSDFKYVMKKMWVVAIDMNTTFVESISQYTNGFEDLETENADLTNERSSNPTAFLPCEFSKFLMSQGRKLGTSVSTLLIQTTTKSSYKDPTQEKTLMFPSMP